MLRTRPRLRASDGYTLVELLVVVLIIGILASVTLAILLNQRGKAQDADAKASVMTAAKAVTIWNTEHGSYTGATPAALARIEPALHGARGLAVETRGDTFTISVDSAAKDQTFSVTRDESGDLIRSCAKPGSGGCLEQADARGNRW